MHVPDKQSVPVPYLRKSRMYLRNYNTYILVPHLHARQTIGTVRYRYLSKSRMYKITIPTYWYRTYICPTNNRYGTGNYASWECTKYNTYILVTHIPTYLVGTYRYLGTNWIIFVLNSFALFSQKQIDLVLFLTYRCRRQKQGGYCYISLHPLRNNSLKGLLVQVRYHLRFKRNYP